MQTSKSPTNLPTISVRLNATNYFYWQKQIETFLAQKGLIHHIQYADFDSYNNKAKTEEKEEEKKEEKKEEKQKQPKKDKTNVVLVL
jgi:hypothetical protein